MTSARYETSIDLASIDAIDTHVHIEVDHEGQSSLPADLAEAASKYFRADGPRPDVDGIAAYYRERRMAAVVFTVDATTHLKQAPLSNDEIIDGAIRHSDVLIPFGSVDPNRDDALDEIGRLIDRGVKGFKFHPTVQGFDPSDDRFAPVYAALQDAGVIALFHTGQVGGGAGARLKYCDPIFLDVVAVDFPRLKIIMAHPSYPWQDVALSIATTRPNAYIDLSGWSPRYFSPHLIHQSNTLLKDKVMFGSDYPVIHPERWLADFAQADFRDAVRPAILKGTAANVLGLT